MFLFYNYRCFHCAYFRKRKLDRVHADLALEMEKCTKYAKSALLEHKTYLRADAAAKNLDMAKYRAEVMKEMEEMDSAKTSEVLSS